MRAFQLSLHVRSSARAAFTLVELIAVMTLIAIFAGVIGFAFMRGGGQSVGLQGAQSSISGLLTFVRGHAATSGRNAALFVNANASNADRYLRFVLPVVRNAANTAWEPLTVGTYLSPGTYVVPFVTPSGSAIVSGESWTNLNSTALQNSTSAPLVSSDSEPWIYLVFTPRGSTSDSGRIVVAQGRPNPPATSPPFVFTSPTNVRGVSVSSYGLTRLVNEPDAF